MMTKAMFAPWWDHFRTINGVTFRAIAAIPKDKIDVHPCKDMRSAKELVGHMYYSMRAISEGVPKGEIQWSEDADKAAVANIKTYDDLVKFAQDGWKVADRIFQNVTDAQLSGIVKTPWGESYPGFICANIIYDEHLHHRGQLYAFLRQLGVEPPFLWSFEQNAPEFQPKAAEKV